MNFLYKESMCNGTNKGPESRRVRSRAEERAKERGKEWKGEQERKERGKKILKGQLYYHVPLPKEQSQVTNTLGIVLPEQDV